MNPDASAINTFLVSGGTAAAVYLIVALLKPYIEGPLPPTARLHDPTLKLLALSLGVVIEVVAHGLIAPLSSQRVFLDIGLGAMAGLSSMGLHVLPKPTPAVADPTPAPLATGELPAVQLHRVEIVTPGLPQPARVAEPTAPAATPEATPPAALVATQEAGPPSPA